MVRVNVSDTKFLNKEQDIKHKDVISFATEGAWEDSKKFKKEDGTPSQQFNITIKLSNGEERSTVLSWGNMKLLVTAWGDETSNWVGKEARAWKTKSEKAKSGYVFLFVPTDWDRDDTGEWIRPGVQADDVDVVEYPDDADDIPLDSPFDNNEDKTKKRKTK